MSEHNILCSFFTRTVSLGYLICVAFAVFFHFILNYNAIVGQLGLILRNEYNIIEKLLHICFCKITFVKFDHCPLIFVQITKIYTTTQK